MKTKVFLQQHLHESSHGGWVIKFKISEIEAEKEIDKLPTLGEQSAWRVTAFDKAPDFIRSYVASPHQLRVDPCYVMMPRRNKWKDRRVAMDRITIHTPNWPVIHQPFNLMILVVFYRVVQAYQWEYMFSPDLTVRQLWLFAKDLTMLASVATRLDDCLPTLPFNPNTPMASDSVKDWTFVPR